MNPPTPGRREFLAGSLAVVFALALEACGSSSSASSTTAKNSTGSGPAASGAGGSVADLAAANTDLMSLEAMVKVAQQAGADPLAGDGPFTLFAPNDDGLITFLQMLSTTGQLPPTMNQIVATAGYHVIDGNTSAADLAKLDGKEVKTHNGAKLKISVEGSTVKVNDATVTTADIAFTNGVIHVIDAFLVPPEFAGGDAAPAPDDTTIASVLASNPELSMLSAGLKTFGLNDLLAGSNELTLFAPSNAAFLTIERTLAAAATIATDGNELSNMLLYHVGAGGAQTSADLAALNGQAINTLAGPPLTVTVEGSTIKINGATVTTADIAASNGVIHVIDTVLVPPSS